LVTTLFQPMRIKPVVLYMELIFFQCVNNLTQVKKAIIRVIGAISRLTIKTSVALNKIDVHQ